MMEVRFNAAIAFDAKSHCLSMACSLSPACNLKDNRVKFVNWKKLQSFIPDLRNFQKCWEIQLKPSVESSHNTEIDVASNFLLRFQKIRNSDFMEKIILGTVDLFKPS